MGTKANIICGEYAEAHHPKGVVKKWGVLWV